MSKKQTEDRSLRPPSRSTSSSGTPTEPNGNDPAANPPATVGRPPARAGDPSGFEIIDEGPSTRGPTRFAGTPWAGWPDGWSVPLNGQLDQLVDTAWMCLDLNASVIASMPPYVLTAGMLTAPPVWITNPDPDLYTSWHEFAKQLWWDFQLGEAFVVVTARFADGWPARFHVVEPWLVNVEMGADGRRHYTIGTQDPGADLLHIRYKSTTGGARGIGPLDAGAARMVAAGVLQWYATRVFQTGGVPDYVIKHPLELSADQVAELQDQWLASRMNALGLPAVLSGGIELEAIQSSPEDMALLDLAKYTDSRIATLLGVPPFLVGLPSGGDSMTYSNVTSLFDYHWRAGLRPKVDPVVAALSWFALPRGTTVEVNRDEYVRPGPLERAQTYQIHTSIGSLTTTEVRALERFNGGGAPGTAPDEPAAEMTPRELAEMVQKIYLGVGSVLTAEEARAILNSGGAALTGPAPTPKGTT